MNASLSGVQEQQSEKGGFAIWPSIASNFAMATLDDSIVATRFLLMDDIGRTIIEQDLLPSIHHFEFNTSDLPSGSYVARLLTKTGTEEAKLIVRH